MGTVGRRVAKVLVCLSVMTGPPKKSLVPLTLCGLGSPCWWTVVTVCVMLAVAGVVTFRAVSLLCMLGQLSCSGCLGGKRRPSVAMTKWLWLVLDPKWSLWQVKL